jgi:hypothetical protein
MNGQTQFDENELKLIQIAKRTLHILAKVIRDKDPKEVIKDKDLADLIGDKSPAEALADSELGKKIKERMTPICRNSIPTRKRW